MACIMLRAPGLFYRIRSMASILGQPLWMRARATRRGALPNPATQCTPIRAGSSPPLSPSLSFFWIFLFFPYFVIFLSEFIKDYWSTYSCCYTGWWFFWKNRSTILSHLSITSFPGSYPSGKANSVTVIPLSTNDFSS